MNRLIRVIIVVAIGALNIALWIFIATFFFASCTVPQSVQYNRFVQHQQHKALRDGKPHSAIMYNKLRKP